METTTRPMITTEDLNAALTYQEYRELIDRLMLVNKTTGENQSEDIVHYAKMNIARMRKWDKIFKLNEDVKEKILAVQTKQIWLVITEGWCGDAAQNIPIMMKLADLNPLIEVRFLLRDENLHIMDQYLTNGGRSIPKLIALKEDNLEELFTWGPRPEPSQKIFLEAKQAGLPYAEILHAWYAKDKGNHTQFELGALVSNT